jgi:CRP-like cAMP-binding protein
MFFLSLGTVEVIVNGANIATLQEGSAFGETALLCNEKRNASIRALTYCDVHKLSKIDFDVLRAKYPEFHMEMKKVTDARTQIARKDELE